MSNFRLSEDGDDDGSGRKEWKGSSQGGKSKGAVGDVPANAVPKSLAKFSRQARMRFVLE